MIDLIIENGAVVSHNKVSNTDIAIKNNILYALTVSGCAFLK